MKSDEYRYWQSRPVHERMDAVEEINRFAYAMSRIKQEPEVSKLQGSIVRIPSPWS